MQLLPQLPASFSASQPPRKPPGAPPQLPVPIPEVATPASPRIPPKQQQQHALRRRRRRPRRAVPPRAVRTAWRGACRRLRRRLQWQRRLQRRDRLSGVARQLPGLERAGMPLAWLWAGAREGVEGDAAQRQCTQCCRERCAVLYVIAPQWRTSMSVEKGWGRQVPSQPLPNLASTASVPSSALLLFPSCLPASPAAALASPATLLASSPAILSPGYLVPLIQ